MRTCVSVLLAAAVPAVCADGLTYPKAKIMDQVDVYHGVRVADPYRWLEDPDSAETRAWVEAENAITLPYLASIPERSAIRKRMAELWNYERYSGFRKAGDRYLYYRHDGLADRPVLYVTRSLDQPGSVLLDPNKFPDKTVALAQAEASPDGHLLAYLLSSAGSDWQEAAFLDIRTGAALPDRLKWLKFTDTSWSEDGKGVYYSRYDEPNEATKGRDLNLNHKLYYHRMGTPQSEDKLVYYRPDQKNWMYHGFETEDARYLIIDVGKGSDRKSALFYRKRNDDSSKTVELLPKFDASYKFVGNEGNIFYVLTDLHASRGRLVAIDIERPEPENWKDIIPESQDSLESVGYSGGRFIASYLKDARSVACLFDRNGKKTADIELPGIGRVLFFGGRQADQETFYGFASYTYPFVVYRLDLKTQHSTELRRPRIPADLSPYETRHVFYNSKDGTRIPMFVTYRKGIKLDGTNPTYLYGYGGFNIPVNLTFSTNYLTWLEMGGVLAMPGLRGGGEYGSEWHEAGTKLKKQNVFDDFIAAAEWLIRNGYTSPRKLAIAGGSNGGLLVAACLLQRPELFGAAVPAVGVLDMLRFHKFTIGWGWVPDYGSADNPEEFKALYAYSPLHNVKRGVKYPPTLITTADHDDRVVPAHSFKFAATLQAAQGGEAPILIRIQTKAGHGAGKPLSMIIDEQADVLAFLARNLHMEVEFARPSN